MLGGKLPQGSRNLDQTGDTGATDAGTCAEFFKGPYNPEEPVRLARIIRETEEI
jgi:hypothetical protein